MCSRKAGRAPGSGRSWAASLDSPRSLLASLLWASSLTPQRPQELVRVGKGSRCLGRIETERSPRASSLLPSGGVALLWQPVAVSKLFHSWAGRSNIFGIPAFEAGAEGTSENSAGLPGSTRPEIGRRPHGRLRDDPPHLRAGPPCTSRLPRCPPLPASPGCFRVGPHLGAPRLCGR